MAIIYTHAGGPYYEWRLSVTGYPPPPSFNEDTTPEGVLYHDWQHGVSKAQAYKDWRAAIARAIAAQNAPPPPVPIAITPQPPSVAPPPPAPPPVPIAIVPQPPSVAPAPPPPVPIAVVPQPPSTPSYALRGHGPALGGLVAVTASAFTSAQVDVINTFLSVAKADSAPYLALLAACCIGFGENAWSNEGCNSGGYCGAWQIGASWQQIQPYSNLLYWTQYAYRNSFYSPSWADTSGGLIGMAQRYPNQSAGWIANAHQGAYSDPTTGANYYGQYTAASVGVINTYYTGATPTLAPTPQSPGPAPAPVQVTTATFAAVFAKVNWAGYLENVFKYIEGGSDEAAHMAQVFTAQRVAPVTTIKPR